MFAALVLSLLFSVLTAIPGFTISLSWVEFLLYIALPFIVIGWILCDLFWTALRPDVKSADHFAETTKRNKLIWLGLIVWAIYTVYATLT